MRPSTDSLQKCCKPKGCPPTPAPINAPDPPRLFRFDRLPPDENRNSPPRSRTMIPSGSRGSFRSSSRPRISARNGDAIGSTSPATAKTISAAPQCSPYANAWRYRDWVVQAINQDMPYDRFLMAQLAGDLMNDASLLPATGLLGLGPWYYGISQPPQSRADERHDRMDMVTRGMLGVTVACARCHDHKYDPFTAKDYYALAGVFASTAYKEYPLVPEAEVAAWKKHKEEMDAAEKALNKFLDEQSARLAERFSSQIAAYMMSTVGSRARTTI